MILTLCDAELDENENDVGLASAGAMESEYGTGLSVRAGALSTTTAGIGGRGGSGDNKEAARVVGYLKKLVNA